MEIWVTKYAMTEGIKKYNATPVGDFVFRAAAGKDYVLLFQRCDCELSEKAAIKKALEMVEAKRESIAQQLNKLMTLDHKFSDRLAEIEAAKAKA